MSETKRPAVDTSVYNLAEDWLTEAEGATEDDVWDLAAQIQLVCEDKDREIADRRRKEQGQ